MLKWFKFIATICGGWWSAMSGAVSIPLAFFALWFGGSGKVWFGVLAFFGLWVFAIGAAIKNYQLIEQSKSERQSHDDAIRKIAAFEKTVAIPLAMKSDEETKLQKQKKDRLAEALEDLGKHRNVLEWIDPKSYEALWGNQEDQESQSWITRAEDAVRFAFDDAEAKRFRNNAEFLPAPQNAKHPHHHKICKDLRNYELRLIALIEKLDSQ